MAIVVAIVTMIMVMAIGNNGKVILSGLDLNRQPTLPGRRLTAATALQGSLGDGDVYQAVWSLGFWCRIWRLMLQAWTLV